MRPNDSHEQRFRETTRMVSPVENLDGSKNIPPHSTGGAFDIYLIDTQGNAVPMGIHPKDWMEDLSGKVSKTDSQFISAIARRNRAAMSKALLAEGFVNYPAEYWHWSYGDRYWALVRHQKHALYGSVASKPQ